MTELRQRRPRVHEPQFLAFTRNLPCCVCGWPNPSQAAHIRMANLELNKTAAGGQEKPDDMWCVPLCGPILGAYPAVIGCHAEQHTMNERDFWERAGLDPFAIAAWNYAAYRSTAARGEPSARKPRKPKVPRKAPQRPRRKAKIASRPFPKTKRGFRT